MTIPLVTALTFTSYTFRCRQCKRLARASQEAIDLHREHHPEHGDLTDRQIAGTFSACLTCQNSTWHHQEIVSEGPWRLIGLTPDDIFALDAAMSVAADDETEEPWPGLFDLREKVSRLVDDVRSVGHKKPDAEWMVTL